MENNVIDYTSVLNDILDSLSASGGSINLILCVVIIILFLAILRGE